MNGYAAEAKSAGIEQDPGNLSRVVALNDQLGAAVSDVWEAWTSLKYGARPAGVDANAPRPVEEDRLARVGYGIQEQVSRLRSLAEEIRGRV